MLGELSTVGAAAVSENLGFSDWGEKEEKKKKKRRRMRRREDVRQKAEKG